jgi:hypothetical protein
MSHYTVDELIARWKKDDMTAEQMIGQMLLLLQQIERRIKDLRREDGPAASPPGKEAPRA